MALFNHFDLYFEKYVQPRNDLHLKYDGKQGEDPFPSRNVTAILQVSATILENCTNKQLYHSYEVSMACLGCQSPLNPTMDTKGSVCETALDEPASCAEYRYSAFHVAHSGGFRSENASNQFSLARLC